MNPLDFLGQIVRVQVDRPLGSNHPRHGFEYLLNYGFVPGVPAPDGEELDAYVLGVFEPIDQFEGRCIAIVHRTNEDDDKLVIVPKDRQYTDDQIRTLTEFQERFHTSIIIRENVDHL